MIHYKSKWVKLLVHTILVLAGNALLALGIACFAVPANIIVGGASGLSLVIKQFVPLSLSTLVLIINIIALILGMFFLGKTFIIGTLVSPFAFPFFLEIFENIPALMNLTSDVLLATIYSALLQGIGLGVIFRIGYSTGGLDIPPLIVNKYTKIPVGTLVNIFDIIVLIVQFPFANTEGILYGIIQVIISGYIINQVSIMGENNIQVTIVSKHYEEIKDMIDKEIGRGVTFLNITTGYLRIDSKAVMVVMSRRQYGTLTETIQKIDPQAFIIASEVHSVKGRGFTLPDVNL